ncbi:hypothetical protein PQX77_021443 [Marasmius sp. AFHP31]|nr:hypothetical protein PQX77_021443 [Marasmius sp. AFHP31]
MTNAIDYLSSHHHFVDFPQVPNVRLLQRVGQGWQTAPFQFQNIDNILICRNYGTDSPLVGSSRRWSRIASFAPLIQSHLLSLLAQTLVLSESDKPAPLAEPLPFSAIRRSDDLLHITWKAFDWKAEIQEIVKPRSDVESHARQANGDAGCETRSITSGDRSRTLRTLLTNVTPFRLSEDLLKDKMLAKWMWVTAEYGKGACLDPILVSGDDDPGTTLPNNRETYSVLSLANRWLNWCMQRTTMPLHPHSHLRTTSHSKIEPESRARFMPISSSHLTTGRKKPYLNPVQMFSPRATNFVPSPRAGSFIQIDSDEPEL